MHIYDLLYCFWIRKHRLGIKVSDYFDSVRTILKFFYRRLLFLGNQMKLFLWGTPDTDIYFAGGIGSLC